MEGYKGRPPAELIPRYWAPGWNSVQSLNKFQEEVGGLLIGGSPGLSLIEMSGSVGSSYFDEIPPAFESRSHVYLTVPLYHIFGSEELSRLSPPILERSPAAYVALNPVLAERIGLEPGQEAEVESGGRSLRLPARLVDTLPADTVGLPIGFPGVPVGFPTWSKLQVSAGEAGGEA